MELIPSSGRHVNSRMIYENPTTGEIARQHYPIGDEAGAEAPSWNIGQLIRKYWLVLLALLLAGAAAGFTSVVLGSPLYKARLLLEVQSVNDAWLKNAFNGASFEANEMTIQTQINILRSGPFLKRGADRLQSETVPLAPMGNDLFSRLRQRVRPAIQDPLENTRRGLERAISSFDARPVTRTRLIELSCESTSPDIAAQFLNSMASEFLEDNSQSRMQSSQKTGEWLSAQIEETKSKLQDSEERLRDFVQASGNLFAGQENTLDDTKLAQLKLELARIQAERIARQSRYELTLKNAPESLAEILNDAVLRGYQQQLSSLQREKAALEITFTPKHEKVRRVEAQIVLLEKTYQDEVTSVIKRIRNDYDAALRQEKLLSSAYSGQSQRVGAEAGKAAQFNALKREVDTLRQMYQSLLMQANQAGLSSSVPINPIRIIEAASPPDQAYKPRPILNISFGTVLGLALAAGIVVLRERTDRSIRSPGSTRRLMNAPELGVIPNLRVNANALIRSNGGNRAQENQLLSLNGNLENHAGALLDWEEAPAFIAESFRGTLASILRVQGYGSSQKTILVTSAGPAEGKTTVVHNLGIALAETGRKVLLIDADFRRPVLHKRFNVANKDSLIDLLSEDIPVEDYTPERLGRSTGVPGLSILPNRPTNNNVAKALYSPRLRTIFQTLRTHYDMILVDAPPILHLSDARIVAPLTDAVILVMRSGVTEQESAMAAYERMREDGLFLLGTVLTDCEPSSGYRKHYYYDYADHD